MSKLPVISGKECIKALEKTGYKVIRQKGSHIVLTTSNPTNMLVVPNHKEIDRGTLRAIIRQANLTIDEFISLLK